MNRSQQRMAALMLVVLAVGGGWFGVERLREMRGGIAPASDGTLPTFTLPDLDGHPRSQSEWQGKVLLVNFWATWCPPCRAEIPSFIDAQQRFGAQGLQVVGIAVDDPEAVRDFVKVYGVNFPVLRGDEGGIEVARAMGNRFDTLPFSALFDREGRLVHEHPGLLTSEALEAQLRPLF